MIGILGSINMDIIVNMDRLPIPGETVTGHHYVTVPGGKGANQALAATRAGAEVKLAGAVGTDHFTDQAVALLDQAGTDLEFIKTVDGATGTALIFVGGCGENMIAIVAGANNQVGSQDAEMLLNSMGQGDSVLLQMEINAEAIKTALIQARTRQIRSIFNIAPATPEAIELAPFADVIIANETEFDLLIGKGILSSEERQNEMRRYGEYTQRSVVVTLGRDGIIAQHDNRFFQACGLAIEPVDTVGAGDTFCGYFAYGLDKGLGFQQALEQAAIAGSVTCLKLGAQPAIPMLSEVLNAQV